MRLHRYTIHKEWMIRSYVVTFGFVLFRFLDDMTTSYELDDASVTIIWACWTIPLFITEMVLQWNKKS